MPRFRFWARAFLQVTLKDVDWTDHVPAEPTLTPLFRVLRQMTPASAFEAFFIVDEGADRAEVLATMAELRSRGLACDTDYARRSRKGQLTQAGRLGARLTVIVDAQGMRIARSGGDEPATRAELVARLAS